MRSVWQQRTRRRGGRDNPAPSRVNHIIYPCVGTQGTREGGRQPALSPKFFLMPYTYTCDALLGRSLKSNYSGLPQEGDAEQMKTNTSGQR